MRNGFLKTIVTAVLVIAMTTNVAYAQSSIDELKEQKEEIHKERDEAQQSLKDLVGEKRDILEFAEEIDNKIMTYEEKLAVLEKKKADAEEQITVLEGEIQYARALEREQYKIIKDHIRNNYENSTYNYLDAMLSATDFADILNKTEYFEQVNKYDQNVLSAYIEQKMILTNKQSLLETSLEAIDGIEAQYQDEKDALTVLYEGKQKQINNYNSDINELTSLVERLDQLEALIDQRIAYIIATMSGGGNGGGGGGNGGGGSLPGGVIPTNGAEFGGVLMWPMPASTKITSPFGLRDKPTAGASTNHKGIDIACPIGSQVVAAADGIVIYVGYMSSSGNSVLVDHGSGVVTCYYHLSKWLVDVGDNVKMGDLIALSGNTGISTGPHLHFAVRELGYFVDPMNYFK